MPHYNLSSIGDRVFPGSYTLHSAFSKAANFVLGEHLVAVVSEEVGRGPVNLVVRGLEPSEASSLKIDEDSIAINGETFPFDQEKIYRSRIEAASIDRGRLKKNLPAFEKALLDLSPPKSLAFLLDPAREAEFTTSFEKEFVKRIKDAVSKTFRPPVGAGRRPGPFRPSPLSNPNVGADRRVGPSINGIKKLRGLGFGLTPSGDDFNAGLLTALNLKEMTDGSDLTELKETVFQTARGKNPLSNSFLALARDGCCFERFKDLLHSLGSGNETQVRKAANPLIAHGETSGSDLGVGFLLAMQKTISSNFQSPNSK